MELGSAEWPVEEMAPPHFSVTLDGATVPVGLRRLSDIEEYRQCESLQERIWGPEDIGRASLLVMLTAEHNGGLVIGAFARDRLIGFAYSFLGLTPAGRLKHCSILLAVEPQFHRSGIGYQLKRAQREAVLAQGLDLITWTFDPLAGVNAYLNLRKLGCVSSVYLENYYGIATGGLNAGLVTDRFLVEWWIRSDHVERRLQRQGQEPSVKGVLINDVMLRSGLPVNREYRLDLEEPVLLVEIPEDLRALKAVDMGLAYAWRMVLREVFARYLASGYRVEDFFRRKYQGRVRSCYVLRKGRRLASVQ